MHTLADRLSPHLVETHHSETLLVNQLTKALAAGGRPVYRFGFGQSPFPVPEHIVEALREAAHRKEYLDVHGLGELRQAAATFHSGPNSPSGPPGRTAWNPDRVIVGAGSKILLYCLLAALRQADVALVSPCWVSYEPQAKLARHRVFTLETSIADNWLLSPEKLELFCRERETPELPLILILNYPGNPTGQTYSAEQLAALARVLRAHNVVVISDEIYGFLHHEGAHVSLADYYPEGTIVTTGLSKWCGAGGWRLGITHIPEQLGSEYFSRVVGVCSETFSCASTPVQYAGLAAYQDPAGVAGFLQQQRSILADVGTVCAHGLLEAEVRVCSPVGGFYLFPDFSSHSEALLRRGIATGGELTTQLLNDTGVALLPGSAFGMSPSSLTARLAYVDFDGTAALQEHRADARHMVDGIRRIGKWLSQ